jgi:hypothetical protein
MINKIKSGIGKFVLSPLINGPLLPPREREKVVMQELQNAFQELPHQEMPGNSPSEDIWIDNMNQLRELVLNKDPRGFLNWPVVSRTMFVGNSNYLSNEFGCLKNSPEWENRWRTAIREDTVGHPRRFYGYPFTSGNLIHHAYHLIQFEQSTGLRVDDLDFIFEFGGGYGSMCRLFHNLGFKGKYLIFDLPHFVALQRFFLKSIGRPVVPSIDSFRSTPSGILCISDVEQVTEFLSDAGKMANSLFMATWSISETTIELRETLLPSIVSFDAFLISYHHTFGEVNNTEFFQTWIDSFDNDIRWQTQEITHLPHDYYLMGNRK